MKTTRDAVHAFLTAGGSISPQEAAMNLNKNFERVVAVAAQMKWPFPDKALPRDEVRELFLDFLEEAGVLRA